MRAETPERLRVGPPSRLDNRVVTDRRTGEVFWVYRTFTDLQWAAGHERDRWYFCPLTCTRKTPVSISYPSFEACLRGLADSQEFKEQLHAPAQATAAPRPA